MTEEQQKEQFSVAYVRAVAAVAGINIYRPEVDDDSVDIGFAARAFDGLPLRPQPAEHRLLADLDPADLAAYLRDTGWSEESIRPGHSAVWRHAANGTAVELELPLRRDFGDYLARLAEAVHLLAAVERRPARAVLDDLTLPAAGEVRFAVIDREEELTARADLNADDHAVAGAAYLAGDLVRFRGVLHRLPRLSRIDQIEAFERVRLDREGVPIVSGHPG